MPKHFLFKKLQWPLFKPFFLMYVQRDFVTSPCSHRFLIGRFVFRRLSSESQTFVLRRFYSDVSIQTFVFRSFRTSVRGIDFLPQIATSASLSCFGAKIPLPAFFIASAFLAPAAFFASLARFFTGLPEFLEVRAAALRSRYIYTVFTQCIDNSES